MQTLEEALTHSLSYFIDPDKRINILYLLSSLILAFYVFKTSKIRGSFWRYIFNKRVWLGRSAVVDYIFFFFNGLLKVLLLGPYIIFGFYIAFYINEYLLQIFGYPEFSLSITKTLVLYTITLTIVNDFFSYFIHYLMHKIPFLWEFHKTHHSATTLNPLTQYRIHPIELIINNVRNILVFGFITGVFDYLSHHQIDKIMFLGVNVFTFLFFFFGANLRHSHVKLKYPKVIEYIFISPFQHQIHHSTKKIHFNKNMGSKFAIWDYLFGTLVLSESTSRLNFGIPKEDLKYDSAIENFSNPFIKIFNKFKRFFIRKDKY
tara:strand:- start:254 stop:1207 length:954 start_codon:yes stop_codon:yes gene_type:complete